MNNENMHKCDDKKNIDFVFPDASFMLQKLKYKNRWSA